MSVERSQTSYNDNAAREVDRPADRPVDKPRQPEPEAVDKFRNLMQSKAKGEGKDGKELRQQAREGSGEGGQLQGADGSERKLATEQGVQRRGDSQNDSGGQKRSGDNTMQPAELAALMQAQVMTHHAPSAMPTAAPVAHANPQALADMLERHVRQLAATPGGIEHDQGQVLLRLNDATLPGTDLLLSRTEDGGWLLRADVRSRGSFEAIQQAAPKLAERFASRNLGTLQVDPHFNG